MKEIFLYLKDKYENLSNIKKLVLLIFGVIVLMILVNLISNFSLKETIIDYDHITPESLVELSDVTNDRKIYTILDNIITDFLNTSIGKRKINEKEVKIKDYYNNALLEDYKYNMSFSEFKKIANNFFSKIFNEDIKYSKIPLDYVIKDIYVYSKSQNLYIVNLNTNSEEEAYIGIKIDMSNEHKYHIFYID